MRTTPLDPKLIVIPEDRREPDRETVAALIESMREIGLIQPIIVQRRQQNQRPFLVAGRHRLEAAIQLRWDSIDALEMPAIDGDDERATKGRLTEIAENLHRRTISQIERGELIAEWVRMLERCNEVSGQLDQKPSGGRPRGGKSEAARQLGLPRKTVERGVKVASLSQKAKETAVRLGVADNQRLLLRATTVSDEQEQVAIIERESGYTDLRRTFSGLSSQWNRSPKEVRKAVREDFRKEYGIDIETLIGGGV